MKYAMVISLVFTSVFAGFFFTEDQQAQGLMNRGQYAEAAKQFEDPFRQGTAWFKAGEFKKADQAFARVGNADAEYNRGNCLVMLGKYDEAVKRYDRALKLKPDFPAAKENRKIATARAKLTKNEGGDMGDQKIGADEIKFDKKKKSNGQETETEGEKPLTDQEMQALWLKKIQTKPADFLKAKFSYQLTFEDEEEKDE